MRKCEGVRGCVRECKEVCESERKCVEEVCESEMKYAGVRKSVRKKCARKYAGVRKSVRKKCARKYVRVKGSVRKYEEVRRSVRE